MLYILVTAAPPFDGENDRQIMDNVKKMKFSFDSKDYLIAVPEAKHLTEEVKDLIKRILVPA